jgi:lambda family phage tail tape measure protein
MSDNKIVIDSSDVVKAQSTLRELSDQLDKMSNSTGNAEGAVKKMASEMSISSRLTVGALGAVATAAGAVFVACNYLKDASIEAADKMNDLANRTNITTERLSLLDAMAKMAGSSADELVSSAERLGAKLAKQDEASGRAAQALRTLGLSTTDANGATKSMLALQEEIVMAVDRATDKAKAQGSAIQLLGNEYHKIKTAVKEAAEGQGAMYDYMVKTNALISGSLAKNSDEYNDKVSKLSLAFTGIGNSIADAALPFLNKFYDKLISIASKSAELIKQYSGGDAIYNNKSAIEKTYEAEANARNTMKLYEGKFGSSAEAERAKAQTTLLGIASLRRKLQDEGLALMRAAEGAKTDATTGKAGEGITPAGKPGKTNEELHKDKQQYLDKEILAHKVKLDILNGISEEQLIINKYNDAYYSKYPKAQVEELKNIELQELALKQKKDVGEQVYADAIKAFALADRQQKTQNMALAGLSNEVALYRIQTEVMKKFGATQNDVNIAQNEYNLGKAQTALLYKGMEGFEEGEEQRLRNEIEFLKAKGKQLKEISDIDETDRTRQRSFSTGWQESFKQYENDAGNASKNAETLFSAASKGMEDSMAKFAQTGKLSFSGMATSILADIARIASRRAISSIFSLFSADGNVFDSGTVLKSADGNVFDTPTMHSYSGGLGMLGEAGPEAVMPLQRTASGKLGVISQGGGGQVNNISVNVSVQGGNTNEQTGNAVASKVAEQFTRGIVRQELMMAKRTGGMLNPV